MIFASDFDGTLVDSYTPIPEAHKAALALIGKDHLWSKAVELEDFLDASGIYDKRILYRRLIPGLPDSVVEKMTKRYWEVRTRKTVPREGALEAIETLLSKGWTFVILTGSDGMPGIKRNRVMHSTFGPLADQVVVVGEDVSSRREFFKDLQSRAVFVDDKVGPLQEVMDLQNVIPVRILPGDWPLKKAWEGEFNPTFKDWMEILQFCLNLSLSE